MANSIKDFELSDEMLKETAGGNFGDDVRGTVCNLTYGCLTIRETPSNSARILGGLENGDWVQVLGRVGDFYYVYTQCDPLPAPCGTPAFAGNGYVNVNFVHIYNAS